MNWGSGGYEMYAYTGIPFGASGAPMRNPHYFFRPGLTWPLRGIALSAQAVPAGCAFSVAGKMAFAEVSELPSFLALFNSRPFDFLINTRAGKVGGVQYEVGLIQSTPVPELQQKQRDDLSLVARRAWRLRRLLDTINENSLAFLLPSALAERRSWLDPAAAGRELGRIQAQIDDLAFDLYGIGPEDRAAIEHASVGASLNNDMEEEVENEAEDAGEDDAPVGGYVDSLNSWLVGVSFGRFDPCLATGERAVPPEPEPFDPLPSRSPGMYPEGEVPADRPDILIDDEGHPDDLAARAWPSRSV